MQRLSSLLSYLRVSRLVAGTRVRDLLCGWIPACRLGSDANDTAPLKQICARVDRVNRLQEELPKQQAASDEVRHQLEALVTQCHWGKERLNRFKIFSFSAGASNDFEEKFTLIEGEIEFTFRGKKSSVRAGLTVNIPANARIRFETTPWIGLCRPLETR